MVTVKGFVGLLRKDLEAGDSTRVEKDLQSISSASDMMAVLLDDLLELSRIGRVVDAPQAIVLDDLFKDALELVYGQIIESEASVDLQKDMPTIFADRSRMLEVVQNLLDNALKFARQGEPPSIQISATEADGMACCCITDNGIGIDPAHQSSIFGLFDQLDPSLEGTGIGLALVKRILEAHQGSITVDSAGEGHGASFCFTLPVHTADAGDDRRAGKERRKGDKNKAPGSNIP